MLIDMPPDHRCLLEVGNDDNEIMAIVGRDERHAGLPHPVLRPGTTPRNGPQSSISGYMIGDIYLGRP